MFNNQQKLLIQRVLQKW